MMWDSLDSLDSDIQEEVSDCVYAVAMASDSPVRGLNPGRQSMLAELNERASMVLKSMQNMVRGTTVSSLIITGFTYVQDRIKLSMRISVRGNITELTIVL